MTDRPLSYWTTVARMGFENDLHRLFNELGISRAELAQRVGVSPAYVSKVLNGTAGNYQLETMAKWARAMGAILQIRLIQEGKEVVRVVDYDTANNIDNAAASNTAQPEPSKQRPDSDAIAPNNVLHFHRTITASGGNPFRIIPETASNG